MGSMISTVPACIDALVTLAAAALPDVQVLDGGPAADTDPDVIAIGFTGSPGDSAIVSTRSREQLATDPDRESYEITCLASCWKGHNTEAQAVRNQAYEMVRVLAVALARDSTLGGVVARARISTERFAQEQTSMGAVATIEFVIHCDAYTS